MVDNSMIAAVYHGKDDVRVEEVDVPRISESQALIRVAYAGICGTDLNIYHGGHPRAKPPLIMGHEFSGRIAQIRSSGHSHNLNEGDKATVEPLLSCGQCLPCLTGASHVCQFLKLIGIDMDGAFASYVAVPIAKIHKLPESLSSRAGALVEPLAVAVHAVRLSSLRVGDSAVVIGAGPVGISLAAVLKAAGAGRVLLSEVSKYRLKAAEKLGVTLIDAGAVDPKSAILEMTDMVGADIVFDAAAQPTVAQQLVAITRVRGEIVLVGTYKSPTALDLQNITFKEIRMKGSRVYTSEDFDAAIQMHSSGNIDLEPFVSHMFPLERVEEGLSIAGSPEQGLKVLFKVGSE